MADPTANQVSMPENRRSALLLIAGALLALPVRYLFLQTHGPYAAALGRIVWGLDHHDFSRWAVFPALLVLPGVRAFHLQLKDATGRTGLWGYGLFFSGLVLGVLGQVWDYILFDPWVHPLHGVGFMLQLLAILAMTAGLPLWALSVFRPLPGWQRSIPVFWMLHIAGLWIFALLSEENWLYPRFAVDGGFIADILLSIAFVMMGLALTSERGES